MEEQKRETEHSRVVALKKTQRETMQAVVSIGTISTTLGHPVHPELTCTVMSFESVELNVRQTTDHTRAEVTVGDLKVMNTAGAALKELPRNQRFRQHSSASLRMSRNLQESLVLGRGEYTHPGLAFER